MQNKERNMINSGKAWSWNSKYSLTTEGAKIDCARKFFEKINEEAANAGAKYDVVDSYDRLLSVVMKWRTAQINWLRLLSAVSCSPITAG